MVFPLELSWTEDYSLLLALLRNYTTCQRLKLHFIMAQNLQSDEQTGYVNQKLDQYLQLFVNKRQSNWYDLLPIAEFQHNNYIYASTQQCLFLLDTGYLPYVDFEPYQQESEVKEIMKFTVQIKSTLEEAKLAICKSQENMKLYYNCYQISALVFKSGDKMYLDSTDIYIICPSGKLSYQCLKPYVVEKQVRPMAYCLKLPPSMRQLYLVFNVVKLTLLN